MITLKNDYATATISLYGAQVMSFIPHGQPDVLWSTTPAYLDAAFAKNKALRGGIPLCWPWFLAHPTDSTAPSHGVGRVREWALVAVDETPEEARAVLRLELDGTDAYWPHKTRAELSVVLTHELSVSLTTVNLSATPFTLKQALHTYLQIGDIAKVSLHDLTGLTRRHVSSGTPYAPHEGPFMFTEETEQLVGPTHELTLHDPLLGRTISVTNSGSTEFVVWNPWVEKAAGLDMPPDSYKHMVCLEAATLDDAPVVAAGDAFTLTTRIAVGA